MKKLPVITAKPEIRIKENPKAEAIKKAPDEVIAMAMANKKNRNVLVMIDDISKTKKDPKSETLSKSLSFFRRGDTREAKPLDKFDIASNYEKFLGVDAAEAKRIYDMTLGYAYAYQVLGSLYFHKKESETLEDLIPDYKGKTGKAKDTKANMSNPDAYNAYRDRLIDKHFFSADKRGYLEARLPRFDRFIEIWCND